jgi:hypothetical protein
MIFTPGSPAILIKLLQHVSSYTLSHLRLNWYSAMKTRSNHRTEGTYVGWNFNSGNYLFTTDTKYEG